MSKSEKLNECILPVVTGLGYEFVGCEYLPQGRRSLLRIYIDSPQGIRLGDCERVSKQLSAVLDVEDPIHGQYTLEVSSPGLDRPLFTLDHYRRYIGQIIRCRVKLPIDGRRKFSGVLREVINEEAIVMEVEEQSVTIPYETIEKANLVGGAQ